MAAQGSSAGDKAWKSTRAAAKVDRKRRRRSERHSRRCSSGREDDGPDSVRAGGRQSRAISDKKRTPSSASLEKTPTPTSGPLMTSLTQGLSASTSRSRAVSLQFLVDMATLPASGQLQTTEHPKLQRRRKKARERERDRVKNMKVAFQRLQQSMPFIPQETSLSKIKALKFAIQYIRFLGDQACQDGPRQDGARSIADSSLPLNVLPSCANSSLNLLPTTAGCIQEPSIEIPDFSSESDDSLSGPDDCCAFDVPWSSATINAILTENYRDGQLFPLVA